MRKFFLMGISLLTPAIAMAQQEGVLPDAPASSTAVNAVKGDKPARAPQSDSQIPAAPALRPAQVLTPWSGADNLGGAAWHAAIDRVNQPLTEYASPGVRVDLDKLMARMSRPSGGS